MSLKIKEMESLKEYQPAPARPGCCEIPLFHGTRKYALEAGEEERSRFFAACDKVIRFAKPLAWKWPVDEAAMEEYLRTKNPDFLGVVVSQYNTDSYAYGSFYVTTSYTTAITHAANAGGELGQWAYIQCVGFRDLQIPMDEETEAAVRIVTEAYEKYQNSEKVVLVYTNVDYRNMQTREGDPFLRKLEDGTPDEVCNDFRIRNLHRCKETDNGSTELAYRILKPEAYTGQLIHEKDLKAGISVFTQIRDVEKYLKRSYSPSLKELAK